MFCAAGMSDAVVAFGETATPDWVLLEATSDGDGAGAVISCCCGWTVDWVESAAIRAEAPLAALSLAGAVLLLSTLATLCFLGTGALASFTGAAAGAGRFSAAAGGVAGVLASGIICAGCAVGSAGWLLAATTGLGCMERPAEA